MAAIKNITCTVCPIGCRLKVEMTDDGNTDNGMIKEITGNSCKRGKAYANAEILNPVRTLTSTVKIHGVTNEKLLPVRTDSPIPKGKLFEAMKLIKAVDVNIPVKVGDVIIKDFINDGINLIACKSIP